MLAAFDNRYFCPTRQNISSVLIPNKYNQYIKNIANKIEGASSVVITTDGWRSIANDSYLSVTAHVVDDDIDGRLSLQNYILEL